MGWSCLEWLRIQENSAGNTFATKSINRSRLMLAAVSRRYLTSHLEQKVPSDNRPDRETTDSCGASRALPGRFRRPDPQDRHGHCSSDRALFATWPCSANETAAHRPFRARIWLVP